MPSQTCLRLEGSYIIKGLMRHQSHTLTLSISPFSPSEHFHPSADMAEGTLASMAWIKSLGCDFERVEASRCRVRPGDKTSPQTGLSKRENC